MNVNFGNSDKKWKSFALVVNTKFSIYAICIFGIYMTITRSLDNDKLKFDCGNVW
jgi:hypothetical protein